MGGIQIWNLDDLTRLMDFTNFYSLESWWSVYAPDSSGNLDFSEREVVDSGGENIFEKYNVQIKNETITINNAQYNSDKQNNNNQIYLYELTDIGIIRKK